MDLLGYEKCVIMYDKIYIDILGINNKWIFDSR